jgi:hypothetical protein
MEGFVSGTGNIELDNDCQYSIDLRSTRSRESVVPKEDLAFYFNTYIEPKYGLGNINVSNVASFMKDLEMNWSKLTPELKDKVLNIIVDNILNNPQSNYDFKTRLLAKIGFNPNNQTNQTNPNNQNNKNKSGFGETSKGGINFLPIGVTVLALIVLFFTINKMCKTKQINYSRLI